jgi:DNA end-binding protein Ku
VHADDGARIEQKRICSKEDKEVPYKEVVKGYEVRQGEYVVLSQDEIAAAAGAQAHVIELEEFVCAAEIDPVFYDRTYYLGAGDHGHDAYRLLHDALDKATRAGLGRWVFHNREYLVAVRPLGEVLALHTMHFADELLDADRFDVPSPSRTPTKREVEMAAQLVASLHGRFDPEAFQDSYRERVLELIATKARGEQPATPEPQKTDDLPDLAAALEASLAAPRGNRSRRSGGGHGGRAKSPGRDRQKARA